MATSIAKSKVKAKDQTVLFESCRNGNLERVKAVLTRENVNSVDMAGRKSTPLHFAAGEC